MAITSLDKVGAGGQYPREIIKVSTPTLVSGRPQSLFYLAGVPGPATAPSPGLSGASLTTYSGQIPFNNPVSGNTNLARFVAQATISGQLLLVDRLWHNSGLDLTSTGSQTINSTAWPARDGNGLTDGTGVLVALEVTTATGSGTPTITVTYTNESGTGSRTGTNIHTTTASSQIGSFYPISLQAGDVGVRSIQSVQLSATWTSGAASLVAYRVISRLELPSDQIPNAIDWITSGGPQMFDNSVPFLVFIARSTTASQIQGQVIWTQG